MIFSMNGMVWVVPEVWITWTKSMILLSVTVSSVNGMIRIVLKIGVGWI